MQSIKRLQQKQAMFGAMLTFVFGATWSAILMAILPIKAACESLRDRKNAIDKKLTAYEKLLKAFAEVKEKARLDLAAFSFGIMSTVRSWAVKTGKDDLALQMKATYSQLKNMTFDKLLKKTQLAIDLVTPLLSNLAEYKITQQSIDDWNKKCKALSDLMDTGSVAYKERTQLGDSIESDMSKAMTFFNTEFAPLFAPFMISQPDLFGSFMKIKRIGTPNTHHTRLNATCVSEWGMPYFGLTIQVDAYTDPESKKTYDAVTAFSDLNGYGEVSGFFPAIRSVTISGPGVVTTTFPNIKFSKGKALDRQFILEQASFSLPAPVQDKLKAKS